MENRRGYKINTMNSKKENIIIASLCVVTSVLFLLIASPYTSILNNYYGYDSAVFMLVGRGWLQGYVPYVELFDHKGPLLFFINALGFYLYDGKLGVFLIQTVFFTIDLYLVYKISRLFIKKHQAVVIEVAFLFFYCAMISEGNMTEEWSLPFILLPMWLSLNYLQQGKEASKHPFGYSLIYGMCFSVHALIRLTNAALVCGIVLAFLILLLQQRAYKELVLHAGVVLLGVVIVFIPFSLYFFMQNAFYDFVYACFIHNFLHATNGSTSKTMLDMIVVICRVALVPVGCYSAFLLKKNELLSQNSFVAISCLSGVSVVVMFLGYGYLHYYLLIVPIMLLSLCFMIRLYQLSNHQAQKWVLGVALCCAVLPYVWFAARHIGKNILFDFFGYYDTRVSSVEKIMAEIPEDEQNEVWGYEIWASFYLYAEIIPCYKYFSLQSVYISSNNQIYTAIEEMLQESPPRWILASSNLDAIDNDAVVAALTEGYIEVYCSTDGFQLSVYQRIED